MNVRRMLAFVGILLAILVAAQPVLAGSLNQPGLDTGTIMRITTGAQGNGGGTYAAISANGQFVTFESAAQDLVPGQVKDSWDTLVHDLNTGTDERVDTQSDGTPVYNPGAYTSSPSISADGSVVAFNSQAEDLVVNDSNGWPDVFVHNRKTNETTLVSVAANAKSGNDASYTPAISANGRFVAFQSFASNLVQADTNDSLDVFVRDLQAGTTERVSVTSTGAQGSDFHDYGFPGVAISGDGRYVAFSYQYLPVSSSPKPGLPGIYLRDRQTQTTQYITQGTLPAISPDGRYLAFVTSAALTASDKNNSPDVYLYNTVTSQFERISVPDSLADTPDAIILSQPSISADGYYVAFETTVPLLASDTNGVSDIYVRNRANQSTSLISKAADGNAGDKESHNPAISNDGRAIAFTSLATNLVAAANNGIGNVYVYARSDFFFTNGIRSIYLPVVSQ